MNLNEEKSSENILPCILLSDCENETSTQYICIFWNTIRFYDLENTSTPYSLQSLDFYDVKIGKQCSRAAGFKKFGQNYSWRMLWRKLFNSRFELFLIFHLAPRILSEKIVKYYQALNCHPYSTKRFLL